MLSSIRTKKNTIDPATQKALQLARHTGTLDLSNRNLSSLPQELLSFHKLVFGSDKWWELLPLKRLVLSHNALTVFAFETESQTLSSSLNDNAFFESFGDLQFINLSYNHLYQITPRLFVLPNLTRIELQHNSLSDSFIQIVNDYFNFTFASPSNSSSLSSVQCALQYLNLSHNQLTHPGTWLSHCSSLTELNLSHNRLQKWENITLSQLRRLNLSHNCLTTLCVTSLFQLAELEAQHNRLQCVEVNDVHHLLTRLDLSNNALRSIPSVGSNVQEMLLSHNLIAFFPSSITTSLFNIHTLDLSDNSLEVLPFDFTSFTALCRLYLANNYLNTLPLSLASLTNLTTLTLHGNPLFSLPTLHRFVSSNTQHTDTGKVLNYLRLLKQNSSTVDKETKFTNENIPSSTFSESQHSACQQERVLDISKERTTELIKSNDLFKFVTNLSSPLSSIHSLRLCGLRLQSDTLPLGLTTLTSLTLLDLSHNLLCTLPPMTSLTRLLTLHLDYNRLLSLDSLHLTVLSSLQTLTVSNNQITCVNALTVLKNLTMCDLSYNDLQNLDPHIGMLTTLKTLNLEGNPIRTIRRMILERGASAILNYLRLQLPDS